MSPSRLIAVCVGIQLLSLAGSAAETRFDSGHGHLAVKSQKDTDWRVVHETDIIDSPSQLRTSPQGPIKITLSDGELFLGIDTDLSLDAAGHKIVLHRGRVRLKVADSASSLWHVASGTEVVTCPKASEIAMTSGRTRPMIDVLIGRVEIRQTGPDAKMVGSHDAPGENVTGEGEHPDIALMKDGVEGWLRRARFATEVHQAQGLGQLVTKDAQSESPVRLDIARYHVNVVLQPPVALVQIDQSFFNPYATQQEGTFVFNLPTGASVSRFAMYVTPESLIEGELIERSRADKIYTTIVRSKRDPAILEQIGDNLFRMRVFPIFARDTKRILMDFTIPLVAEHGGFAFNLPLMSDLKPIGDFSLKGTIHPPFAVPTIQSATHPRMRFMPAADGVVTFAEKAERVRPPSHFSLRYSAPADAQPIVRTYKPAGEAEQYFAATIPAHLNPPREHRAQPVDLLLLVDTSGSPRDLKPAFRAARSIAGGLRATDRIQIGCIDSTFRPLSEGWSAPDSPQTDAAWRRLTEQFALGVANLDTILPQALQVYQDSPPERRKLVLYIGNGATNSRPVGPESAAGKVTEIPHEFCAVELGSDRNGTDWLKRRVSMTKGRLFDLNGITDPLRALFEWSLAGFPAPTQIDSVVIDGIEVGDLFYEQAWIPGRDFHVYGRGKVDALQIAIKTGDQQTKVSATPKVSLRSEDVFTGRLWASQKLQSLLRAPAAASANGQLEIVRLCQEWSLMSPLTAFLVLETEADYVRWGVDRKLRRRYWNPDGAVVAAALPSKLARPISLLPTFDLAVRKRVQRIMNLADKNLTEGDPALAARLLSSIRREGPAVDAARYQELQRRAEAEAKPQQVFPELKLWRPLADRNATDRTFPVVTPLLGINQGGISPQFLEYHPHARELLRTIPDCPVEMPLPEFAKLIHQRTGLPVVIDRTALSDEGINYDQKLDLNGLSGVTIRSLLAEGLQTGGMACVPQRYLLKITTRARADELLVTQVYPVEDLLTRDPLPPPHSLKDPYVDVADAARRRLTAKLNQPISAKFEDTPLSNALEYLSEVMGTPIRLDFGSLADEGIKADAQVAVQLENVPAEVVLETILEPLGLTTIIRNETLKVLTAAKADETFEMRLYSTVGLEDVTTAGNLQRRRRQYYWGYGMAPMGGMGMGGFGGMGGGTFGGGAMGGLGGMGGGMGGMNVGGGIPAPAGPPDAMSSLEPFDIAAPVPEESDSSQSDAVPESGDDGLLQTLSDQRITVSAENLLGTVHQTNSGKWMDVDQEGGEVGYYPLAQTLVVRQTSQVHKELEETFRQLRRKVSTFASQPPPDMSPTDLQPHLDALERLIQQTTGARWILVDQEGGSMQSNIPTKTLAIRQTHAAQEEITRLLTLLRRARYRAATAATSHARLTEIDDAPLFERQSMTDLPRSTKAPALPTPDELRWLTARRVPATLNQRWRSRSVSTGSQRDCAIRRTESRLELALPEKIVRTEAQQAAVAYPTLTLVEIDNWGDAGRQLADAALPWLPHRSNEELASLFDVTFVEEDSRSITLRLNFPGLADTYLQATYAKLTRQPDKWVAVVGNQPQFELEFDLKAVVARDPRGRELERWELIAEEATRPIPPLNRDWGNALIVDARDGEAVLERSEKTKDANTEAAVTSTGQLYSAAYRSMFRGDYVDARRLLKSALQIQPDQPLLNLLLVWTGEFTDRRTDPDVRANRTALEQVFGSSADPLIRLVTPTNFPSLSPADIQEALSAVPVERRSAEVWTRLAEHERAAGHWEMALAMVEQALRKSTDDEGPRRLILKIDLLLRSGGNAEAKRLALSVTSASNAELLQIADLFAGAGLRDVEDQIFERIRQKTQPKGEELAQLLERQADTYPIGKRRWELLLEAQAALPGDKNLTDDIPQIIWDEATSNEHALILGELAATVQNKSVQAKLRIIQADLLDDRKQAGQIIQELSDAGQIGEDHFYWSLKVLEEAERFPDIVRIIEARLKKSRPIDLRVQLILRDAYTRLGRETDARRADDERFRNIAPLPRPAPPRPAPMGTGFFSVK